MDLGPYFVPRHQLFILLTSTYLGSVLFEQVQLQRLVQVQLPVTPALQQVAPGPLQPL